MENIIAAHNLVFHYPQDPRIALDNLSLEVKRGELVAVLGHNGSGKSTFAKHINAVLLPEGGVCYVDGIDTKDESRLLELRSKAGMVFQNPDNQIVATIVEEDVAFGLENIGVPPAEIRERVDQALRDVGMYDYRLHAPHQLSGGQKQRVAIAGIIAMRPNIVILDEPTAMLDPKGRREVLDTIIKLNRDFGVTVLLITHYMDEAAKCDRVVVVEQGKVLLDAPPKQVFSHVNVLREVGLDVPQATELIFELRKHAINLPSDIIEIGECAEAIANYVKAKGITDIPEPHKQVISRPLQREIALEAKNLSYVYSPGTPFEKVAVEDFNIQIEKGDFVGVIGHTGSGKSTFIQHLNGLLRPTGGTVLLNGKDIWKEPKAIRKVRFQVGLVFQYPEYQLFEETVAKDIAFGPANMGLSQQEIDSRVTEAAEYVGLPEEVMERSPFELSGGQKRRVAIAGVLAMRPDVLILDEPTAGLDPKGREQIFHEINQYHKNTGSTVLLVSHSMEDIAKVANRVIVINDSKIFAYGTVDEVFSRTRELHEMGLSVPQISHIFLKLRELGVPVSEHVYTIEAARDDLLRILGKGGAVDA